MKRNFGQQVRELADYGSKPGYENWRACCLGYWKLKGGKYAFEWGNLKGAKFKRPLFHERKKRKWSLSRWTQHQQDMARDRAWGWA